MSIDWNSVQENAGGNFKNFYEDGDYTVKCDGVEFKEVGTNGSIAMKFHFEEGENGKYPTADHWLSFKNESWRQWHNKCLMVMFGATDEAAKKAVEMAESKSGKENIIKGYEACYKKLLAKKPEVKIEVYTTTNPSNGKQYAAAEFKDRSVAMPHGDDNKQADTDDTTLVEAEDISNDIDLSDVPF